ncbi:MAG: hypothetical protein R3D44_06535 [Hyphomicrobiaceae bacterium]
MGFGKVSAGVTASLCSVAIGLVLAGCANAPAPAIGTWTEGRCVDDSPNCIKARQAELRVILSDRQHKWVHHPPTADSYAGGVRLFAFKTRKRELTCAELSVGHKEAEAGPAVLRGPAGKHLTPAQISRGAMLSSEVSRELQGELRRRCRR